MIRLISRYFLALLFILTTLIASQKETEASAHFEDQGSIFTKEERQYLSSKKELNFVTAAEPWKPFLFKNRQGDMDGLEIDYVRLLESKLNIPIKMTYLPWKDAVEQTKQHQFDAIFPASPTDGCCRSAMSIVMVAGRVMR